MEKYTNDHGKECYRDVTGSETFNPNLMHEVELPYETEDVSFALHTNLGSITVVDRLTGFSGYVRDTESGFRDPEGRFWLASGMLDVRESGAKTISDAIDWIKNNANNCVGHKPN